MTSRIPDWVARTIPAPRAEGMGMRARVRAGAVGGAFVGSGFLAIGLLRMLVGFVFLLVVGRTISGIVGPLTLVGTLRSLGAAVAYIGSFSAAGAVVASLAPLMKRRWGRHFLCYLAVAVTLTLITLAVEWYDHTPITLGEIGGFVGLMTPVFGTVLVIGTRDWPPLEEAGPREMS